MTNTHKISVAEIEALLKTTGGLSFAAVDKAEAYGWIEDTLIHYRYHKLGKETKGIIRQYIQKLTGYSKGFVKRLIGVWRKTGKVKKVSYTRHSFTTTYGRTDTLLLAGADQAHLTLSGPATKAILVREHTVFGKSEFATLAGISVSHIYNLRQSFAYREKLKNYTHTKQAKAPIGERRKPEPEGKPGYIRVDSVHQGDGPITGKSVYHINFVDEVTQWEFVACVEGISERFLLPALEAILNQFPFIVVNFHSNNGSEYINKRVAEILARLFINQTKSRPRHSNDNGLAETKNGTVIRKHMGYHHIPKGYAAAINSWYQAYFNTYLNYHRPCAYPKRITNKKGKEVYVYRQEDYMIPYAKLKSLPNVEQYLKEGVTFEQLDKIAYAMSDTDFAKSMQVAKRKLFENLKSN